MEMVSKPGTVLAIVLVDVVRVVVRRVVVDRVLDRLVGRLVGTLPVERLGGLLLVGPGCPEGATLLLGPTGDGPREGRTEEGAGEGLGTGMMFSDEDGDGAGSMGPPGFMLMGRSEELDPWAEAAWPMASMAMKLLILIVALRLVEQERDLRV